MKITIDEKVFPCEYDTENKRINIDLNGTKEDFIFFARWAKFMEGRTKEQYAKNVTFETTTLNGVFENAIPLVDINEKWVKLSFDVMKWEWKDF